MSTVVTLATPVSTEIKAEIKTTPRGTSYRVCTVDLNNLIPFFAKMNIDPDTGPRMYYYFEPEKDFVLGVRSEPKPPPEKRAPVRKAFRTKRKKKD